MTTLLLIEHVPGLHLLAGMIIFVAFCLVCSFLETAKKATSKR